MSRILLGSRGNSLAFFSFLLFERCLSQFFFFLSFFSFCPVWGKATVFLPESQCPLSMPTLSLAPTLFYPSAEDNPNKHPWSTGFIFHRLLSRGWPKKERKERSLSAHTTSHKKVAQVKSEPELLLSSMVLGEPPLSFMSPHPPHWQCSTSPPPFSLFVCLD